MRQDTAKSNCGTDQRVELFITTDGELQMTGRDTLDFEIFRSVLRKKVSIMHVVRRCGGKTYASKFEDFGRKVFQNGGHVDGSCGKLSKHDGFMNGHRGAYPWRQPASYFGCYSSGIA